MEGATAIISSVASLSTDILAIAAVFVVLFFGCLAKGNKVFVAAVLSFYPAALLYAYIPPQAILTGEGTAGAFLNKLAVFITLASLSFLVIKYFIRRRITAEGGKKGLQAAALSLSLVALIVTLVAVIIPIDDLYSLSPLLVQIVNEQTAAGWLAGPLVLLYLLIRE